MNECEYFKVVFLRFGETGGHVVGYGFACCCTLERCLNSIQIFACTARLLFFCLGSVVSSHYQKKKYLYIYIDFKKIDIKFFFPYLLLL